MIKYPLYRLTLVLLFSIISVTLRAKSLTREDALNVAVEFFGKAVATKSMGYDIEFKWDSNSIIPVTRSAEDYSPTFYIFTPTDGAGFIIVAAEDSVRPVLGYSFDSNIPDVNDLPANFKSWLLKCHTAISKVRQDDMAASPMTKGLWDNINIGKDIVLMETAKWGQGSPFNLQCPMDADKLSVAGCTAVATAIVMNYHKWPVSGIGVTDAYWTDSHGIYVPERNLEHAYDWDSMLNEYYTGVYTSEQADAVATLLADIGYAFQADYTANSTSAAVEIKALCENFGYDSGLYYASKEYYSDSEWMQMLYNELLNDYPVLYRGDDGYIGHAFVLDGITDNDYFHINWGWSGYCDGYFYLSSLTPGEDNYFSDDQGAYLNFHPNKEGRSDPAEWLKVMTPGISASTESFSQYTPFTMDVYYMINVTQRDFDGEICFAIVGKNNEIKEWISDILTVSLKSYYYTSRYNINCVITKEIVTGDRIRGFYKSKDSNEWFTMVSYGDDCVWELFVTDRFSIEESTSIEYMRSESKLIIRFKEGVSVMIYRNQDRISDNLKYNYDYVEIDTKALEDGTYDIVLTKGTEKKEVSFTIKQL